MSSSHPTVLPSTAQNAAKYLALLKKVVETIWHSLHIYSVACTGKSLQIEQWCNSQNANVTLGREGDQTTEKAIPVGLWGHQGYMAIYIRVSTFNATKECREQRDSALIGGSALPTVELQVTTQEGTNIVPKLKTNYSFINRH